MLEKEFKYYLDHQKELVKKYNGKIIVIIDDKIVGEYHNKKDAYIESIKKYKPGTFLIIECTPGPDSYTIHQRSRIIAASWYFYMRNKILKSKYIHIELSNQATEIHSKITISHPEDFKNEDGIECIGIWDTGSEGCLISRELAKKLKLVLISYKIVVGVTGEQLSPEYLVNIFLPNSDSFEGISTLIGNKLDNDEFIIGMNVINKGDFAITNVNNKTTMSFRSPSVARINFENEYKKAKKEQQDIDRKQNKATRRTQKKRKRKKFK